VAVSVTICFVTSRTQPDEDAAGRPAWQRALREHRLRLRLSQPDVARRSGLSVSAVRSYESGDRHPSREALTAVIDALGLTSEQANPILNGAGYAGNWHAIYNEAYGPRDVSWFAEQVERFAWPVFVTNEASDLIAANKASRRILDIPPGHALPDGEWNMLAEGSKPKLAERLESWDDNMRFTLGLGKALVRREVNPERVPPWVAKAYERFLQGDPALVTRMLQLWSSSEPVAHTTRMTYPVRWRREDGTLLRFTAIMTVADVWHVFAWHDWIPDDAETLAAVFVA
jgi:transcriptional regulator with XRE-family HTH domain